MKFFTMMIVGLAGNLALEHWQIGPDWVADLFLAAAIYGLAMCLVADFAEQAFKGWNLGRKKDAERHAKEVFEALQRNMKEMFGDNVQFFDLDEMDDEDDNKKTAPKQEINPEGVKH